MPITKQAILDDVQLYSAEELYQHILDGIVTFEELKNETDGNFAPKVRKRIEQLIGSGEENEWALALSKNDEAAYQDFIARHPESPHCGEAREKILALQNASTAKKTSSVWEALDKTDIDALRDFVTRYPDHSKVPEAKKLINDILSKPFIRYDSSKLLAEIRDIETDRFVLDKAQTMVDLIKNRLNEKKIGRADLLEVIRNDHNVLPARAVSSLIQQGDISYVDLEDIGIDRRFIEELVVPHKSEILPFKRPISRINKVSTEVYFWGIPSSGKTCALGGILKVAGNGRLATMSVDIDCQGYGYMTRLPQLFHTDGVSLLPEGTPVYATYEMGFDLEDQKHLSHPITCIDLAGELIKCMYKSSTGDTMSDEDELALDTLTRILIDNRSVNRKVHFFVVEYGGENRLYDGLPQSVYLDAALRYIERTRIFEKDTDAVYLIITKVDKVGKHGPELEKALRDYISGTHYNGFYRGVQQICRKHEINGGTVEIIPFSLGEVCFQNFCLFDEGASVQVVRKILDRSKGFKTDKLSKFLKK